MQFLRRNIFGLLRSSLRTERNFVLKHFPRFLYKFNNVKTGGFLLSLSWLASDSKKSKMQNLIADADGLFAENKYRQVYELLENYKDSSDVELLWRIARAEFKLSQEQATSPEEKKKLIYDGFEIITKSLSLDQNHSANHKWMSALLDARSTYDGIKARISNLPTVKEHMMKASELNPKDATVLHMIGLWCYNIADMPWYQRKIAATVFAAPPESSYEEALVYFEKAESVDPKFYSQNLLMIGKTYLKLKNKEKAELFLTMARDYRAANNDDIQAVKEASELLKNL